MRVVKKILLALFWILASACGESIKIQDTRLDIPSDTQYYLQGTLVDKSDLASTLTKMNASGNISLKISVDHTVNYSSVTPVLDAARAAGIIRIAFVSDQEPKN